MMGTITAPASGLSGAIGRQDRGVEPWLLVLALNTDPARIDARTVWFPGLIAPLPLPATTMPASLRAHRLLAEGRLPLGERVAGAFAWGEDAQALAAAATQVRPLAADPQLDAALTRWAEVQARQLGLGEPGALVAVDVDGRPRSPSADERLALGEVQGLLTTLPWPRWRGALVLLPHGLEHPALAPGRVRAVRPALPVLRIPAGGRTELAAAMADLSLALCVPPARGWPSWLTVGVAACARARAAGTPTSPDGARARRGAAGSVAIAALLAADAADAALSEAVVAYLLHPSRVAHLPDLLDLLRQGAGGAGALATAYGLTPERLADPSR